MLMSHNYKKLSSNAKSSLINLFFNGKKIVGDYIFKQSYKSHIKKSRWGSEKKYILLIDIIFQELNANIHF